MATEFELWKREYDKLHRGDIIHYSINKGFSTTCGRFKNYCSFKFSDNKEIINCKKCAEKVKKIQRTEVREAK